MVLVESNARRRNQVASALRSAGITVVAVERIGELERWPVGDVVVTESAFGTPWWKLVGATHVVVLANSAHLGRKACSEGASAWVPRMCAPEVLLAVLRELHLTPVTTVANESCSF